MVEIRFIETQRGWRKLIYDDYIYIFDRKNLQNLSWRCSTHSCRGRLHTNFEITEVLFFSPHCHEREKYKISRLEFAGRLKKLALETNTSFQTAIVQDSNKIDNDEKKKIGNIDHIRDYYTRLRNTRYKAKLEKEDDILPIYKITYNNEKFLHLDTGIDDDSRILLFYTIDSLKLVPRTNCILCDATFRTAPRGFRQLLVIHIMFFNKRIPLIFALMNKKSLVCYKKIFQHIKEKIGDYDKYIVTDFELGLLNAMRGVFSSAKFFGCNFHWSQILWRYIQHSHLVMNYKDGKDIKKVTKYLLLLSYVPEERVESEFRKIYQLYGTLRDCKGLLDYFQETFLKEDETDFRNHKSFWSVYSRILGDIPTTTNSLEAWHSHLNSKIRKNTPNLCRVIDLVKLEEQKTRITIDNLLSGDYRVRNRDLGVKKIVLNYFFYEDMEFLDQLNSKLNFKLK